MKQRNEVGERVRGSGSQSSPGRPLAVVRRILGHEAAEGRKGGVFLRLLGWQLMKRAVKRPVVVRAFGEGVIRCWPDSALSGAMIYHGLPDWHEMHFLKRVLRPGDGFLDIGANIGVYSVLASTCVMPGGRIEAFEPDPTLFARLLENFGLNGIPPSGAHNVAIGETSGVIGFCGGKDAVGAVESAHAPGNIRVPMRRLDEVASGAFVIAKVDIEGYELAALKGAGRLLQSDGVQCWLLETNGASQRYGASRTELHSFLGTFGYQLYSVANSGRTLQKLAFGGPYPANALAVRDPDWLRERLGDIQVVAEPTSS